MLLKKAGRARLNAEEYLAQNDSFSFSFFEMTGDFIMTGATGSKPSFAIAREERKI